MSLQSAENWIKHIHQDQELGQKLLSVNNWDMYFSIAKEKGFDFTSSELDQAWEKEFGSQEVSDNDLEQISGGANGDGDKKKRPPHSAVLGIRG